MNDDLNSQKAEVTEELLEKAADIVKRVCNRAVEDKIKEIAEDFVENEYYRVGRRSYAWEEWPDNPVDDLDSTVETGECMPSDQENYSWWEIISTQVVSSKISERDDETREYCVDVEAWVAVSSGNRDEELDPNVEPSLRIIYVQVKRDEDGDFAIVGTEE